MTLSVLIPTYNYDVFPLVECIRASHSLLKDDVKLEILVADDASSDPYLSHKLVTDANTGAYTLLIAKENMGRSAVRNWLAEQATGEWLLFLDADAMPISDCFLEDMLNAAKESEVVCATITGYDSCPDPSVSLRWNYDRMVLRHLHAAGRNSHPYTSFSTFCFLISAEAFRKTGGFNRHFKGYGHEDTLFGRLLAENNISIKHIDSRVRHCGLEPNPVFLKKSRLANETLVSHQQLLLQDSRLLQWTEKVERYGMLPLCAWAYKVASHRMEQCLCNASVPNLKLFQFYKLAHICHLFLQAKRSGGQGALQHVEL